MYLNFGPGVELSYTNYSCNTEGGCPAYQRPSRCNPLVHTSVFMDKKPLAKDYKYLEVAFIVLESVLHIATAEICYSFKDPEWPTSTCIM